MFTTLFSIRRLCLAALFVVPTLVQAQTFTNCFVQGTMTEEGSGSSCRVFQRRKHAEQRAIADARAVVIAKMQSINWLWEPFCIDMCEAADLEYAGYTAGGVCGYEVLDLDEDTGSACSFPSVGPRRIATVEVEFNTGCLCRGA